MGRGDAQPAHRARVKILHVVPSYFPAVRYGGPIHSVHGLCKALAARGHDVHVYTTNVDGPADSDVPLDVPVALDGVQVRYFPVPAARRFYWAPAMARELHRSVGHFDVVHTHSVFLWPTWAAARIAREHGVPYVVAPRGMLVKELIERRSPVAKRAWIAMVERRNLRSAASVHFTSELELREARRLGVPLPDVCIVPNGVDVGGEVLAAADETSGFVLFLGRLSWKKRIDRLVRAMVDVRGASLVIAGPDEDGHRAQLEELVAGQGLLDRVAFVGAVHGDEKASLLARAALLVLPSHSENFGNVVLEALAAGCPVIVSPEVGAAGIVAELGAGLVVESDPALLGRAIQRLIDDHDLRQAMGARGRDGARRRYGWDGIAAQMEAAYSRAIGQVDGTAAPRAA